MVIIVQRLFFWKLIPCEALTSALYLLFLPRTVHCSTKNAYTSKITFLASQSVKSGSTLHNIALVTLTSDCMMLRWVSIFKTVHTEIWIRFLKAWYFYWASPWKYLSKRFWRNLPCYSIVNLHCTTSTKHGKISLINMQVWEGYSWF